MIRNVLYKLGSLRSALAVGVSVPFLVAAGALAQGPTPTPSDVTNSAPVDPAANANRGGGEATTERVVVTGSYIPTAETESALPVTVYTAAVLQKQGAQQPIEGLRQLPSFVGNAATENDSNGGNGQAFINLRAIGQENVLTLINGRRAFEYSDINAIPIGAIDRTEILKDGAAAIYGSDAVAGVVNFVLINGPGTAPYEGAEVYGLYGNTTETDAHVWQGYIRGGVATDKVSIAAVGEYYSREDLYSRDRAKLAGSGNLSNDPTGLGRGGNNGNSPTFAGRVSVLAGPLPFTTGAQVLIDLSTNQVTPASYRRFEPNPNAPGYVARPGDFLPGQDPSRFNFRAFTPAIPSVEKAMYYITGRYKVFGEALQLYGDVMYSKTKQNNGLAPAPFSITSAANGRNEARASIFNPFGAQLGSLAYRLVNELGSRRSFFDHDYYRYVAGINGDFNFKDNSFISHFGYDTGFVYERFDEIRTDSGDATRSAIRALIASNTFNPFIGQNAPPVGTAPTYLNGVPTGLTAPYNNLSASNLVTEGGASYIANSIFKERDFLYDVKLNAHFFPGMYNGGIDLAVGYEHRNVDQKSTPDPVQAGNDQLGFNQSPRTSTLTKVDSVFTELNFPIVTSTMNVPFVRSLEIAVAYRYEKFKFKDQYTHNTSQLKNFNPDEDFGGSPRISIRYQPIADLTLRANFNQSFRAPGAAAFFDPITQDFPVLFDPLNRSTGQPPEGVARGGNLNLRPETTDAYSAGLVYTPKFIPGFTITADLYQLFTTNLVLSGNDFAQVLLTNNTLDPDGPQLNGGGPALGVTRAPDGTLISIDSATGNAGKRLVEGLDVTAVYQLPTQRFGTFTFSLGYNHFFIWKAQADPGQAAHNFLGDYNNGTFPLAPGAIPFNKGLARFEWQYKGFDFNMTGNYIGDYEDDPNFIAGNDLVPGSPGTGATDPPPGNPSFISHHRVSDFTTLDMQVAYEFKKPEMQAAAAGYSKDGKDAKSQMSAVAGADNSSIWQRMLWNTTITVGVNNVFDRYPPTVLGAFNDNYDTSLYNIRNRFVYVSLKKKF